MRLLGPVEPVALNRSLLALALSLAGLGVLYGGWVLFHSACFGDCHSPAGLRVGDGIAGLSFWVGGLSSPW